MREAALTGRCKSDTMQMPLDLEWVTELRPNKLVISGKYLRLKYGSNIADFLNTLTATSYTVEPWLVPPRDHGADRELWHAAQPSVTRE